MGDFRVDSLGFLFAEAAEFGEGHSFLEEKRNAGEGARGKRNQPQDHSRGNSVFLADAIQTCERHDRQGLRAAIFVRSSAGVSIFRSSSIQGPLSRCPAPGRATPTARCNASRGLTLSSQCLLSQVAPRHNGAWRMGAWASWHPPRPIRESAARNLGGAHEGTPIFT